MKLHKSHFLFAKIAHKLGFIPKNKLDEFVILSGNVASSERLRTIITPNEWNKVRLIYLEKIITQMLVKHKYLISEEYEQIMALEMKNAHTNEKIWEPIILSNGIITADMEHCYLKGFSKKGGDVPGLIDGNLLAAKKREHQNEEYDSTFLRIGDYIVEKQLSETPVSKTYKTRHQKLDKTFVIKTFDFPFKSELGSSIRIFSQEMKIITKLRHKNIIPVHDIGVFENHHYIVMPFISGISLKKEISKEKLTLHQSLAIVLKLSETLGIVHRHNLVHKNLTPSSIIIDETSIPYLKGFGLKNLLQKLLPQEISTQNKYYAPEQILRNPPTTQTDVYSLGIILYEILTGKHPYNSHFKNKIKYAVFFSKLPWKNTNVPKEIKWICEKATAKKPKHRYANGAEMARDIRAYLNGQSLSASRISYKTKIAYQLRHYTLHFVMAIFLVCPFVAFTSYQHYTNYSDSKLLKKELLTKLAELKNSELNIRTLKKFHEIINQYQILLAHKKYLSLRTDYTNALIDFYEYSLKIDLDLAMYLLRQLKAEPIDDEIFRKLEQKFWKKRQS